MSTVPRHVLHRHGALSCWDYATAGPYLPIEMARQGRRVPLSAQVHRRPRHSRCAGRQARAAAQSRALGARAAEPSCSSARTATPTTPTRSTREEGGTPAIIESIRAGLVFALKEEIGAEEIRRRERQLASRALASWSEQPEHRDPRQHHRATASGDLRSACATRRGCCIPTSS